MVEDTPDDYIHDLFNQTIWGQEGLGQSILGRRQTIASFTREDLIHHISKYYGTKDIIISCAGKFQPAKLMGLLRERFGGLRRGSEPKKGPTPEFNNDVKVYSISKDAVTLTFRPTSPFCPLGVQLALNIKRRLQKLDGVKRPRVKVVGHVQEDMINKTLESS